MNTNQRFAQVLEAGLTAYPGFHKSVHTNAFTPDTIVTYWWPSLTIDVIGDECCFTATAAGKSIVFAFYADDVDEVAEDVLRQIGEVVVAHE